MPIGPLRLIKDAWAIGRQFEEVITLNKRTQDAIGEIGTRLRVIEDRLLMLEAEQVRTIVEAKSAAAGAATTMAAGALFEAATRIAQLEVRVSVLDERSHRLPPPDKR